MTDQQRFVDVAEASGLSRSMAHHWLASGWIDLPKPGSGHTIWLNRVQAMALNDIIGQYLQATESYGLLLAKLHDGRLWDEAVNRNVVHLIQSGEGVSQ